MGQASKGTSRYENEKMGFLFVGFSIRCLLRIDGDKSIWPGISGF